MKNSSNYIAALFFLFLTFLLKTTVYCQYQNIEFDHYTPTDGLSHNYINCILKDSKGFIWIGTANGLNRFDGISFRNYFFDSNDTTSICENNVMAIVEDSTGFLWIATANGLCTYDRKTDNFSRKVLIAPDFANTNPTLVSLFIDSKGFIWIGSAGNPGAIYRYKLCNNPNKQNKVIDTEQYNLPEKDPELTHQSEVYSFVEDQNKTIWLASFSNTLFYFNDTLSKFIAYPINHQDVKNFSNKHKQLFMSGNGDFYITIEWNGLLVWERKSNKFNLYKPNGTTSGPNYDILYDMAEDRNGLIWIGARDIGGINIFDSKTRKFNYCVSEDTDPYSLSSNKVNCLYKDPTGIMWVGCNGAMDKFAPDKVKFKRYFYNTKNPDGLSSNDVLCFAESKSGAIWIGTNGTGLDKLDRSTGKFTHYMNDPSDPRSISSNSIISICEDHKGTLWMGTFNGGLVKMQNNIFYSYLPNPSDPYSISYRHIWYVFEDSKKNLWAGTLNNGLELLDRKTNRFYHFRNDNNKPTSLVNNGILGIFEDSKRHLYVTNYGGVSIIDLDQYDFSKTPPNIKFRNLVHSDSANSISGKGIFCMAEDKQGNLWFGTFSTGIDKFDPKTGRFTNYSAKDGLPGNTIKSILFDNENNLWLASDKGLAVFNPVTKAIRVFDKTNGLLNKTLHSWALKTKDGEMFFGGLDGFNSFYPDEIKFNKNKNPIVITGLRIFNKPVKANEKVNNRVVLINDISETGKLVLTYRENFITFEFVALDYTTPEKIEYAYMMEGFDKDWIYCAKKREANYTNLDPGNYTFKVKASNSDNIWNEEGTSLKIVILPAWWNTLLFRMLVILSLISIVFSLYRIRVGLLKKRQRMLEDVVKTRTDELSSVVSQLKDKQEEVTLQNEELVRHRNDLEKLIDERTIELKDAKEKAEESDRLKSAFLANMSHEIRTPMNAIVGFASLMDEDDLTPGEREYFIKTIKNNSDSLLTIINDILDISLIDANQLVLFKEIFCVDEILDELKSYYNLRNQKQLNIEFTTENPEKKTYLYNDPMRFRQIMTNLINNAYKYTDQGYVRFGYEPEGKMIRFYVEDTGIGISEENIDRVFNYFNKIEPDSKKFHQGTGIGLAICKKLIAQMGGSISVESEVNKGSLFRFSLPIQAGEKVDFT